MAFLTDFTIDYVNRRIKHTSGKTVYTANEMYSALQDLFDELDQMDDPVPMSAQTPTEYTLINGWFMDEESFKYIKGGAIKTSGWDAGLYNDGIRTLTFNAAGYVNIADTDIGKPVVGSTSGHSGTLLAYNNTTRQWWVRVDSTADTFQAGEEVTITGGTVTTGNSLATTQTGEVLYANIYSLGTLAEVAFTLNGAHSAGATSVTVTETVDSTVPQTGYIHLSADGGVTYKPYKYSSWTGSTFTLDATEHPTGLEEAYADGDMAAIYPNIYVVQNGTKLAGWWPTGHIDILVRVIDWDGTEIDGAQVTVFCRNWTDLYDHFPIDLSAGGRNAVPLATFDDLNNQSDLTTVEGWAHTAIGGTNASGVNITFGAVSKDINDGNGPQPYDVTVDCAGMPLSQVYEVLKWVTREGSTTTLNSVDGEQYISANAAYAPVKASPFGTYAGGTLFGARGVWLENLHPDDVQSYQLIDSNGVTRTPPNYQNVEILGLEVGDRVSVFRTTGDNYDIDTAMFTSHATNNTSGSATFEVNEVIPSDVPSEGYIRVVNADGTQERYHYSSWSGSVFTLDATDHPTGLSKNYDGTSTAYVPFIDTEAGGAAVGATWNGTDKKLYVTVIYTADRYLMARVRKKGILPFQIKGVFSSTGYRASAIRTPDTIVQ